MIQMAIADIDNKWARRAVWIFPGLIVCAAVFVCTFIIVMCQSTTDAWTELRDKWEVDARWFRAVARNCWRR